MYPITKAQVIDEIPMKTYDGEVYTNMWARKTYGPNAHGLNHATAKKLVGQTVYGLQGAEYMSTQATQEDKINVIKAITIEGFVDESGNLNDEPESKDDVIQLLVNGKKQLAYACGGQSKIFGTGTRCNYVFVFAAKRHSPKKSPKSAKKSPKKSASPK